MTEERFAPGTILAGKYRLESRLGQGGMGTVYRAEHLVLQAPVAIKVIEREVAEGDVALARFMREAQAAASLRSPHVVQILDYGTEDDLPFMVMELLEGETLAERIARLGALSPAETYRVMSHVARAVAKAHEAGIVHRDLKPDNVFLVFNEGDEIAKVLDFGVAKIEATALEGASHTRTGSLLGTPYYMSPEQAQGNKEIDYRSDLWALAVIAFESLVGKKPFASDGLGDLVLQICIRDIPIPSQFADVPPGFDAWFARGTQREVEDRFQSARELADALGEALGVHRDTAGSAPESVWSLRGAQLGVGGAAADSGRESRATAPARSVDAQATTDDARGDQGGRTETTLDEPSPASDAAPNSQSVGPLSELGQQALVDSGAAQRGSQWEVVPHGEAEARSGSDSSEASVVPVQPPVRRTSAVVWVALLAAAVGVGGVVGAREAGFDLFGSGDGDPARRSTKVWGADKEPPVDVRPPETKAAKNGSTAAAPPAESKGGSEAEPAPDQEGEALDAVDKAARDALDALDAEEQGTEDPSTEDPDSEEPASDASKPEDASQGEAPPPEPGDSRPKPAGEPKATPSGPKPKVPDTLSPPPPPPPPAEQ